MSLHGLDALATLKASYAERELVRMDVMERIRARFLTTDRYATLVKTFGAALKPLVMRKSLDRPFGPGNRQEGLIVLVVGETGAGKSNAIHRMLDTHPAYTGYANPANPNPAAISIKIRAPSTFLAVGQQVLAATGYPLAGRLPMHEIWQRVSQRLPLSGTTVLHLDEMHNLTDLAKITDTKHLQQTLKSLVVDPEWPISVIVSGLPKLVTFIEGSSELKRRTRPVEFLPLSLEDDEGMLAAVTGELAGMADLIVSEALQTAVMPRLFHAASGQLGTTINLIQEAIDKALEVDAGRLQIEHFALGYAYLSGCSPDANPFRVADWRAVKPASLLRRDTKPSAYDAPAVTPPVKKKRTRVKP
ncbi:hypothetical protein CTI14_00790 [Methylobacterium radiotolerans]|uniref:ATP-binding protein n=1 Tax=Methylobacterium sp. UNC300MFChir4.1 TaxID=1502747 RepID=UPI0008C7D631|nr:ATP-binding protein [Methylobacterium sp. UNC300MFChir4.1]PJI55957.1 hypothetical protein CTI14_00790 [Methylobacterium radiotolerans]SEO46535.1 AAA domain-containing protein [Methylobacterium sp. UNC300MFChir4.1]